MNTVFSIIWNKVLGQFIVASEQAKSGKKSTVRSHTKTQNHTHIAKQTLQPLFLSLALLAVANPLYAAENLKLDDGEVHKESHPDEEKKNYDRIEVRYKGGFKDSDNTRDTNQPTTLEADGLNIEYDPDSDKGAVFSKGGDITLNNSDITVTKESGFTKNTYGIQAYSTQEGETPTRIIGKGLKIKTTGEKVTGVFVNGHGDEHNRSDTTVKLSDSQITTDGKDAKGVLVTGVDGERTGETTFIGNDLTIETEGLNSPGVKVEYAGSAELDGGSVTTKGEKSNAIVSSGQGSHVSIDGTTIESSGQGAKGLEIRDGATAKLDNATITTTGGPAINMNGRDHAGEMNLKLENSTVNYTAPSDDQSTAAAAIIKNGKAALTDNSTINADSNGRDNAYGILAVGTPDTSGWNGTELTISNSTINAVGGNLSGLTLDGNNSATNNRATLTAEVNDSTIETHGNKGHGITLFGLVDEDQEGEVKIEGKNLNIITEGDGSYGARVQGGSSLELTNSNVETKGAKAHGLYIAADYDYGEGLIGTTNVRPDVTLNNTTIDTTSGSNASGIYIVGSGDVTLDNSTIKSSGSSITSELTGTNQTQTIAINSGSQLTENNGTLLEVLGDSAQLDDSEVSFTLGENTDAAGDIIDHTGTLNFIAKEGARWTGKTEGVQDVDFEGGSFTGDAGSKIAGNVDLSDGAEFSGGTPTDFINIAGDVTVNKSTLGGNLNIGGELNGNDMIISPGNSIGIINVGSVDAGATGTLDFEINGEGEADQFIVRTGDFNAGNFKLELSQENGAGGYRINHAYTIVQTEDGEVVDEFNELTNNLNTGPLVKLDPILYEEDNIQVSLSVDQDGVKSAQSHLSDNQKATLGGAVSIAGKNATTDEALKSKNFKVLGVNLDQLSGEVHASTQTALLNSSDLLVNTLSDRMRANLGATKQPGAPTAQASGTPVAGAMPTSTAYPLWAQVVGDWSRLKGNSNTSKIRQNTGGIFLGGDAELADNWRLGGALGYTDSRIRLNSLDSKSDVKSYTLALYGGNSWETDGGNINFLAGTAYTKHKIDTKRHVNVGGSQTLTADYNAHSTQLFTELGYAIPAGTASQVEPYVGLAHTNLRSKSFTESGGSAALKGKRRNNDITTATLGVRGETTFDSGNNTGKLMAGLGWRHAWGDVDAHRKLAFREGNSNYFKVAGAPIAKNAAVLDLGAEMQVGKTAAMGLSYSGQFGSGNQNNSGSLYLRKRF